MSKTKSTTPVTDLKAVTEAVKQLKTQMKSLPKPAISPEAAISPETTQAIIDLIEEAITLFEDYGNQFRPIERMRKNGLGLRNFGFTEHAYANARRNPQFVPSYLDMDVFNQAMADFVSKRDIMGWVRQLNTLVRDGMRVPADAAYGYALEYYGALREAVRRGVVGAEAEFAELSPFFKRTKNSNKPPTEAQLEKDLHALLHGKKDGKIIVENETPKTQKSKRIVIDETQSQAPKGEFEEKITKDIPQKNND
jgi:hypothetical protein